jgi:DDB1- and CUL4-associated factor 13
MARTAIRREKKKAALLAQQTQLAADTQADAVDDILDNEEADEGDEGDKTDLDWSAVIKRTFEAYIRGERPNMYGEWLVW